MSLHGPDVSNHQGQIDWDKAKASGLVDFAIVKASEGITFVDSWFARNWAELARLGLPRGAYHYALPSLNQPEPEADHFLRCVELAGGLREGDSLWLDMEDPDFPVGADAGVWSLRFLQHLEGRIRFLPGIYTYPSYVPERSLNEAGLARYPLWWADYDGAPGPLRGPWSDWAIWQYDHAVLVPGIGARIDGNRFRGTREQLAALGKPGAAQGGIVDEPSAGEVKHYLNARGELVAVVNFGGEATAILGVNYADVGGSVRNAAGAEYDRSLKGGVMQGWVRRPLVDQGG